MNLFISRALPEGFVDHEGLSDGKDMSKMRSMIRIFLVVCHNIF